MKGVFSIAEVVDDSNKQPNKTMLCILTTDENSYFSKEQLHSLKAVEKMVIENGVKVYDNLKHLIYSLENL